MGAGRNSLKQGNYIFEICDCCEKVLIKLYSIDKGYVSITFAVEEIPEIFAKYAEKVLDNGVAKDVVWLEILMDGNPVFYFE